MKNKLMAISLVVASIFATTGCQEEVYEDQRMKSSSERVVKEEFNTYREMIFDSGYNYYSRYVEDLLTSISEDGKVDPDVVRECIRQVDIKKEAVKHVDKKKIDEAVNIIKDDLDKNEISDKPFDKFMLDTKKNISHNKKEILSILDKIDKGLELGLDGEFNEEDRKVLDGIQLDILEIYNNRIK